MITMAESRSAMRLPDPERRDRQSRAGWPVPGVSIRLVDADMRDVARDGEAIGEVVCMSDHVMDGYFREPGGHARTVMTGTFGC